MKTNTDKFDFILKQELNSMKRTLFIILIALFFVTNIYAVSKVGTTAAPFLKIGVGSRALGMGGAIGTLPQAEGQPGVKVTAGEVELEAARHPIGLDEAQGALLCLQDLKGGGVLVLLQKAFPAFTLIYNAFAIPYLFVMGFVVGVMAPLAAIAVMVAGVRFLTGKFPFFSLVGGEEDGDRTVTLSLVPPEDIEDKLAEEKAKIEGDLGPLQAEIRAIIEKAQGEAAEQAEVEVEGQPLED